MEKLTAENEHLKRKIDQMAVDAREMQKLIDTKSSKNIDNEKFENVTNELQERFIILNKAGLMDNSTVSQPNRMIILNMCVYSMYTMVV